MILLDLQALVNSSRPGRAPILRSRQPRFHTPLLTTRASSWEGCDGRLHSPVIATRRLLTGRARHGHCAAGRRSQDFRAFDLCPRAGNGSRPLRQVRHELSHQQMEPDRANRRLRPGSGREGRTPDVDWTVNRVIFVDLAYRAESGQSMTATARLGKLGRTKVAPGEKIQILRSPDSPDLVTGPADAARVAIWGMIFAVGAAMLGASVWIKRLRNPRTIMGATPALAGGFNPGAPAPINRNAQPSFEMAARTHFGRWRRPQTMCGGAEQPEGRLRRKTRR
jgi:hypothetical protein